MRIPRSAVVGSAAIGAVLIGILIGFPISTLVSATPEARPKAAAKARVSHRPRIIEGKQTGNALRELPRRRRQGRGVAGQNCPSSLRT
jgi:hypothetical protein